MCISYGIFFLDWHLNKAFLPFADVHILGQGYQFVIFEVIMYVRRRITYESFHHFIAPLSLHYH
jgi:hypothetical protein